MSDIKKPDSKRGEQATAEELLRKSKEQLALAIEGSGVGLQDWRVQTGEVKFNDRWAQIIGYTLQELAPLSINTWNKLTHPDEFEKSNHLLQKCFNSELPAYECKFRMRHKDEHWVWILDRGKVVGWDKDKKPVRMSGHTANIISHHDALEEGGNFIQKPFFEAGSCLQSTGDAG
jgi:PAS domain S-box-containing protein